jgi:hypothetical protein
MPENHAESDTSKLVKMDEQSRSLIHVRASSPFCLLNCNFPLCIYVCSPMFGGVTHGPVKHKMTSFGAQEATLQHIRCWQVMLS